ncbi:hypothetical protein AKJ42_00910 [candidate division MSBL1 archaeon SCGC-AAA261C02]|uniref:SHSP domain-containing protein n=2 Tax=candidate division MSBL1 TaxID=215777 RepID=A0A133V1T2_9EURY|nr:hypothetical protein AKJ42_00910 [candidate division MSBL1 archaeon SCGC-AAA261C02]
MIRRMLKEMEHGFRPFEERESFEEEFEDPLEKMMKRFEETPEEFEELIKEEETPSGRIRRYGPFVYGFSYSKRPGEEPEFQEFGNIKPGERGEIEPTPRGEREPLTEVVDMEDKYEVTVEVPGVKKDEIDLSATEDSMEIKTTGERKYRKELFFEDSIDPDKIDANFKYGILYVDVEKKEEEEKEGKKIEVK